MTDERCDDHSRRIRDAEIKQARLCQEVSDMKKDQVKLESAFWKVEEKLTERIQSNADKTTKLQIKTAVINAVILILFGIGNAMAIRILMAYIGTLR